MLISKISNRYCKNKPFYAYHQLHKKNELLHYFMLVLIKMINRIDFDDDIIQYN